MGGVALALAIPWLAFHVPWTQRCANELTAVWSKVVSVADDGSKRLFGSLLGSGPPHELGFVCFIVPRIIWVTTLIEVARALGVIQCVAKFFGAIGAKLLGPSIRSAEACIAAVNVVVGQTQAPLFVRPALGRITRSQILTIMACGFATISAELYEVGATGLVAATGRPVAECQLLLLVQCATAAVFALVVTQILEPNGADPASQSVDQNDEEVRRPDECGVDENGSPQRRSIVAVVLSGARTGAIIALSVALIIFVVPSCIELLERFTAWVLTRIGGMELGPQRPLESALGWCLRPVVWAIGVPWDATGDVGAITGRSILLNECVAFDRLRTLDDQVLTPVAGVYAGLTSCHFANFGSIGAQVGALAVLCPTRRSEFVAIAPRAMVCGLVANWCAAAVVGLLA